MSGFRCMIMNFLEKGRLKFSFYKDNFILRGLVVIFATTFLIIFLPSKNDFSGLVAIPVLVIVLEHVTVNTFSDMDFSGVYSFAIMTFKSRDSFGYIITYLIALVGWWCLGLYAFWEIYTRGSTA